MCIGSKAVATMAAATGFEEDDSLPAELIVAPLLQICEAYPSQDLLKVELNV